MEKFKSETDGEDNDNQTFINFESSQFKKEFPDFNDFVKTERKDESNEFLIENNQNLRQI